MDHFCGYTTHFPETQDDVWIRCGAPATLKRTGYWFCAEHFDMIEAAMKTMEPKYQVHCGDCPTTKWDPNE